MSKIAMKIIRETHDLSPYVIDQIMCLADANIASLSTCAITRDSPLLGVERAAVRTNLQQALDFLKTPQVDVDEQGRPGDPVYKVLASRLAYSP